MKTLPQARKTAIEILNASYKGLICVGVFDDEGYLVGRVSKTNSFPFLWEIPSQKTKWRDGWYTPTYKFGGLMREDGVINTRLPANQIWHDGGFYW